MFNCDCPETVLEGKIEKCIPSKWLCDGEADCPNGSDEKDCICPPGQFQCSNCSTGGACDGIVKVNMYQCIAEELVGNKIWDCLNERDEM